MHTFDPQSLLNSHWADLSQQYPLPEIDHERLHAYRLGRLQQQMAEHDVALCLIHSPISLRYAVEYRNYLLFQSHIPTTYLFLPQSGSGILHGAYDPAARLEQRPARAISYFDGGPNLAEQAKDLAKDIKQYLKEIGDPNGTVAVEYINPSVTQALEAQGIHVIDGVLITELARAIKNEDELACMRWAIHVAQHGIDLMKEALKPGVTETQLWGLLNFVNIANDGDWSDGRMLVSGPRTNPWLQEASNRRVESGDLVGFDTDMIGPYGYFADVSRTLFCGNGTPTPEQKQLYQLAYEEVHHNIELLKPGASFEDIRQNAWPIPKQYQAQAYSCLMHGVGMCDEYPQIKHNHRGAQPYEGEIAPGMVICVESYVGAVGENNGVKLEQQVLVTDNGTEVLSTYPFEEKLLSP